MVRLLITSRQIYNEITKVFKNLNFTTFSFILPIRNKLPKYRRLLNIYSFFNKVLSEVNDTQSTMTKFLNAPILSTILNLHLFNLRIHKLKYVQDYGIQMSFKCRTNFNIFWYMYFLLIDHST